MEKNLRISNIIIREIRTLKKVKFFSLGSTGHVKRLPSEKILKSIWFSWNGGLKSYQNNLALFIAISELESVIWDI